LVATGQILGESSQLVELLATSGYAALITGSSALVERIVGMRLRDVRQVGGLWRWDLLVVEHSVIVGDDSCGFRP
jgi:hypothetical protein